MAAKWTPDSWRSHEGLQMPDYRDADALAAAEAQLSSYPPLVFAGEARALKAELAKVSAGQAFLLHQDLPQRLVFRHHPGVHGRDQGLAVDEVHLQGQDAKQEVAVGVVLGLAPWNAPIILAVRACLDFWLTAGPRSS